MPLLIPAHLSSAGNNDRKPKKTYGLSVEEYLDNQYEIRAQALASAYIGGLKVRPMTITEATQRFHGPLSGEYGNSGGLSGYLGRNDDKLAE